MMGTPVYSSAESGEIRGQIKEMIDRYGGDRTELLAVLRHVQEKWRKISPAAIECIAEEMDIPLVHVAGTATFYHFLTDQHAGEYTIYVNTSVTAEMAGSREIVKTFESELGVTLGSTTPDQKIGLRKTSCIGMCDQEPAILINGTVFTRVTPARVKQLVDGMKAHLPVQDLVQVSADRDSVSQSIHTEVKNTVCLKGPVFFSEYLSGQGLKKAMEHDSLDIIEIIKKSGLRGRGGAGFPTGLKWGACRAAESDTRYVICNVDEGEPGTFKDRVLLTELPELIFEGMTVAGFAIDAREGILYLRGEYGYLREYLERTLESMRSRNLLGRRILGTRFSFDIRIKEGAGAYICGEESALIESAEGKRGQPRNRPPFPVTSGYLRRPTVVNNPETLVCALKIVLNGAEWFRKMGTQASSGVKLLSVSGDCKNPGIYEIEWGKTVREVLNLSDAKNVLAVQVGGPSGVCIAEKDFDRKICYSDLSTGGAFTIFSKKRDLLSIVQNYMEFFRDESCGFCVPCRAGNALLVKGLEKIRMGNGVQSDLDALRKLGEMVKTASRCGLGQTSPNPILTTLDRFNNIYLNNLSKEEN